MRYVAAVRDEFGFSYLCWESVRENAPHWCSIEEVSYNFLTPPPPIWVTGRRDRDLLRLTEGPHNSETFFGNPHYTDVFLIPEDEWDVELAMAMAE